MEGWLSFPRMRCDAAFATASIRMADYLFLSIALSELEDAIRWYRQRSPLTADRFAEHIERALDAIEQRPTRFPKWDDQHRFVRIGRFPYYIAYRMAGDHPLIVAIRHTSQDQVDLGSR
jgi:plasmid stabilization system protein ParE